MRRFMLACLLIASFSFAQSDVMTNQSVLNLWNAKWAEAFVIDRIHSQPGAYVVTQDEVRKLQSAGVSESVIAAMALKQSSGVTAPRSNAPGRVLLSGQIGVNNGRSNLPGMNRGSAAPPANLTCAYGAHEWPELGTQEDVGKVFYQDRDGCWRSLRPERINWSRNSLAGFLKVGLSAGTTPRPVKGTLERRYSPNPVRCNEGFVVGIADFAVVPLEQKNEMRRVNSPLRRESDFHIVSRHDMLNPEDLSLLEPASEVAAGEYGVFDYRAFRQDPSGSQDIYTFHCE